MIRYSLADLRKAAPKSRVVPDERPSQVRLVRKHGYLVAVSSRPITQAQTRAYLDKFP